MDPLSPGLLGETIWCILNQPYASNTEPGATAGSNRILDLYVPAGDGPFPLIVWIHGGGWHSGDKQPEGARLAATFLPHGFAVAAVSYRLTSEAPFPAQIEDCDLALAWLRRHATARRIDPERVGLIGHSAGAHLCALMAVVGGRGVWEGVRQPVQAVVCWSPPCDLDRERGAWLRSMFVWNPHPQLERTALPLVRMVARHFPTATAFLPDELCALPLFLQAQNQLPRWLSAYLTAQATLGVFPRRLEWDDDRLLKVFADLDRRPLGQKFSEAELVKNSGLGRSQLNALFVRAAGTTPRRYFERRRLEAARRLLEYTGMSMKEVAADLGFHYESHFSQWFRIRTGTSPSNWKAGSKK